MSAEHQNIVGTKISIVFPEGFVKAENFLGLQQVETASSIMVVDIPKPYLVVSRGMTKKKLRSKGIKVKKIAKLYLNGLPAILVTGSQNAFFNTFTKYILVFGTGEESYVINGACPEDQNRIAAGIRSSLLTLIYEPDKEINPFEAVDFTIDISETKLKFWKSMSNSLAFSVEGGVPIQSSDQTNLIVAKSFSEVIPDDKKRFCAERLGQLLLELESIEYTREVSIGELSGYESLGKGKGNKKGETEYAYQVILFSGALYYILVGTTNDESGESLKHIQKAIQTFRLK